MSDFEKKVGWVMIGVVVVLARGVVSLISDVMNHRSSLLMFRNSISDLLVAVDVAWVVHLWHLDHFRRIPQARLAPIGPATARPCPAHLQIMKF